VNTESAHVSRDDLAAYLLGALSPDEATLHARHLQDCERCQERLLWLRPAVDLLPVAVNQLEPPPGLRDRLMAEVDATAETQVAPVPARRRTWRLPGGLSLGWRPAVALAACALLAVGLAGGYVLHPSSAPRATTTVVARPTNAAPPELASATLEREGNVANLHVKSLPQLPPGKVYETWLQRGDVMEPGSVFVLRKDGSADAAVPGPLAGADAVLVTREPRGGSSSPTSPPLLKAKLG
jgi:anti-sigma-K factor RskA